MVDLQLEMFHQLLILQKMSKSKISPISTDNIKVSYANSAGILFENISVSDANDYEKINPGTTFLFLDGDQKYRYLNIDQVNSLTVSDLITKKSQCDTSPKPLGPPKVVFALGTGIGAEANPIIGPNGELLGIDIVRSGIGYEIPPIIKIVDESNTGSGAVVQATIENGSVSGGIVLDPGNNYIPIQPSTTPESSFGTLLPGSTILGTTPTASLSATYDLNGFVTLTWNTDGATSLSSNFGQTILNGSVILSGTPETQIFSITATNSGGSITKSVIVNIETLLPGSTILGTIPGSQFGTLLPGTQQPGTIPGTQPLGTIPGSQPLGTIFEQEQSYPALLGLQNVVINNPGINYTPGIDVVEISPNNGTILQTIFNPFGQVVEVKIVRSGIGFTERPNITIRSDSGINADFTPVFEIIRDPNALDLKIEQRKILTVIDIVGLQVQGFVGGKPYYGNVYYDNGEKYAGPYKSFDTQIRVYDTLSESIKK